ncbi:MAG: hypothetical protein RR386_05870, partial [Bacteroidaceae bacterium]
LSSYREQRERNKRYTYGDQWCDMILDEDGKSVSEEDYIRSQGNVPLKNNLIRRLVRTVLGTFRGQNKEPTCSANDRDEQKLGETMSVTLQCNWKINRMNELNGRNFEEFLIGGAVFQKETFGWRNDKMDCWTDTPNPTTMFFDSSMNDIRHWDLSIIGEIHDITFEELCSSFAKNSSDYSKLRSIYSLAIDRRYIQNFSDKYMSGVKLRNLDFLSPSETNLCRVIEVWSKEQKPRLRCHDYLNGDYYKDECSNEYVIKKENSSRLEEGMSLGMSEDDIPLIEYEWFMDSYWYFRFLTPFGQILSEGETPYAHHSHPYTIKLYPFIDSEIHSFVSDVIDQQRYVNRLITLNDWVIRASAKGVLMFPEELLSDGYRIEDIAEEWSKFNGMIVFKSKPNVPMPQQIANKCTNIGIGEMIQLQMKLMEDVTGVTGALQGKEGYSGMSASLYQQQQSNASTSLLDLLESFDSFILEASIKKVKNIQQFYDSKRILNIVGKNANGSIEYDPEKINDVEFDLSIIESSNTPIYRMISNDFLLKIWEAGQISIEQLLQFGSFPFADNLLQSIQSNKEELEKDSMQGINSSIAPGSNVPDKISLS